jgi:hypothetical protein
MFGAFLADGFFYGGYRRRLGWYGWRWFDNDALIFASWLSGILAVSAIAKVAFVRARHETSPSTRRVAIINFLTLPLAILPSALHALI